MNPKFDNFLKTTFTLLIALVFSSFGFSQRTISGMVTDFDTKEPLIGANIRIVGTGSGTITDFDGSYSLSIPAENNAIEVSYTGYSTETIQLGTSNQIDIALKAGAVLEEIVVVGYGTQKTKEVTSAITSIKAEEFNKGNVTNPTQLLQGKVAGLTITQPNNDPNGDLGIALRGISSVSGSTQPLIIIDGVLGADLKSVDPSDIESIDVLKDGSAAAIYGTRGTNGVVIITTKKGRAGKPTLEYNGFVAAESVSSSLELLSAEQYRAYVANNPNEKPDDQGASTDWFDQITRTGLSHYHGLSYSGGSNSTTYYASMNFRDVQGVAVSSGFDQLNMRLNVSQKALNDRLKIDLNVTNTSRNIDYVNYGSFQNALIGNPTLPIYVDEATNPDLYERFGSYYQIPGSNDWENPLAQAEQVIDEALFRRFIGSIRADLEIIKGLTLGGFYSTQRSNQRYGKYEPLTSFAGDAVGGRARRALDENFDQLLETTLRYDHTGAKVDFNILGGYSYQAFEAEGFSIQNLDFLTDAFSYNNIESGLGIENGFGSIDSYKNSSRLISFFGRAQASLDDTYLLSVSLRRDGSSKFGADNKWGLFPAVSAGVRLKKFLSGVEIIDDLKFRVGYGVTGNQDVIPSYESLSRYNTAGQNFLLNGVWLQAVSPVSNPNPSLRWERKAETNFGLDFSLMDYKLTGTIDYYIRNTTDLLWRYSVPVPPNLFGETFANAGEIRTSGIELTLGTKPVTRENFGWDLDFNIAFNKNELVSLSNEVYDFGTFRPTGNVGSPGLEGVPTHILEEGQPLGSFYGWEYTSLSETGKWVFEDLNGDDKYTAEDRQVIGNAYPDFTFGLNNSFRLGNFDLNFFLRGSYGNEVLNLKRLFYENETLLPGNLLESLFDNPDLNDVQKYSSYYIEDGSFVRLDNATLGYNFNIGGSGAISKLRLYFTGQNLFVLTNYSGVDPEVNLGGLEPGVDPRQYYPRTRTVTFGLNVGF